MTLFISSELHRELLELAAGSPDAEVCGLLIGEVGIDRIVAAGNIAANPARTFEIDPVALFAAIRAERKGQGRLLGYYHSHPHGPPTPSRRDTEMAFPDGKIWIIIADGRIIAWQMDGSRRFNKIALQITD